ncbi:MAG: Flp pilus assembly protein CpaB [Bacillota bacterium]
MTGGGALRARWRMAGSLVLAVVAGVTVYLYLDSLGERYPVVVAARPVRAGKVLEPGDLRVAMLPGDGVHPQALTCLSDGVGRVTKVELVAGEQVLRVRTLSPAEAGVGCDLLPHLRAMLLPVPAERAGGGTITSGRLVDVLFVSDDPGQPAIARVLAQGLRVLAVRDERGQPWPQGRELPMGVVVAVSAAEAERLAFALEHGSLYLMLCPLEPQPVLTSGVGWENLYLPPTSGVAGDAGPGGTGAPQPP